MASNSNRLRVTELDFDSIKGNLKTFLQAQTEFTDYDFEGSGMNILLDTLAYNTHYLAFNANMLANEMFMDSASLRSSIVSHAKTLGYEVTSSRAPKALVDVKLTTNLGSATMSAGTSFSTTVDDVSYKFVTIEDITAQTSGSYIQFTSTPIYEGTWTTTRYTVDSADVSQKFHIPSDRADTSTLTVKVQNSVSDSTQTTYTKATDITQVTSTSTVYFLQETDAGKFEIYFGDGVIGKKPVDNNLVILQYVVSNRDKANGANVFSNDGAIATVTNVNTILVQKATGGGLPETLVSIQQNAPLDYAAQGRCVTAPDYEIYAKKLYPNTKSVSVWGGETGSYDTSLGVVDTAQYGKVFISIKTTSGNNLTATEKAKLVSDLDRYKVASISPVIVDPETLYLILNVKFKFDSTKTTKSVYDAASEINTTLTDHNTSSLTEFNSPFRHSEVSGKIDDTDASILSNITNINIAKFFTPTTITSASYNVYFRNALFNPHSGYNAAAGGILASTGFKVSGDTTNVHYFDDDGAGVLRRYYLVSGTRTYADSTAGTVDYATGAVAINNIQITSVENVDDATSTQIRIVAIPNSKDIVPVRNQVLEIDFTNISVVGEVDTIASGSSSTSTYTTYPSNPNNTAF